MLVRRPVLLAVLGFVACTEDEDRPGGPGRFDSGPARDAEPEPDAAPDAPADAAPDGPGGFEVIERDYGVDFQTCPAGQVTQWGYLQWEAAVPAEGGRIRFLARTSPTVQGLDGARDITVAEVPPDEPPIYVTELLPEEERNRPILRITAELSWDDADSRPDLESMRLDWVCADRGQ